MLNAQVRAGGPPERLPHAGVVRRRRQPRRGDRGARHPAARHRHRDRQRHRRGEQRVLAVAVRHDGQRRVRRHRDPADTGTEPPGLRAHQPVFVKTSRNADSESFLSVAGRSGRYNNIQIDGAVNNDLFGLAAQGTPGGQANTHPISLDAVSELQGLAQSYSYSFSRTADPREAAEFRVYQLGFYAGDQWRVRDNLTLTYGIRLDAPVFPDTPTANPLVETLYGRATDVVPATRSWSPRIGFNYDPSPRSRNRQQVRGGFGLFHGRTPYVWLSNQYSNTGNEFQRIQVFFDADNRIPFSADPDAQPTDLGSASTNEINLVDPDYRFPQLLRGNLAYDRDLGFFGLVGSVELLFSKTVRDIDYRNLNLVASGAAPDGRPTHARLHRDFSNVILLTNTDQGGSWTVATKLDKRFSDNWFMSGSYLYGESRSVNDGGSSQATSNWRYNYHDGDPNAAPLALSDFSPGHRFSLSGSYRIPAGPTGITLAAYYDAQQGRPYSYLDGSDSNGDGTRGNDLL